MFHLSFKRHQSVRPSVLSYLLLTTLLEMRRVFWDKGSGKHVKALFSWKTDGYSGLFPR